MYVRVLFETTRRRERLAAFGTRVRPSSGVIGPDVPLQVTRVAENFGTSFAREFSAVSEGQVPDQTRFPTVRLWTELTAVLTGFIMMTGHQMIVQSKKD